MSATGDRDAGFTLLEALTTLALTAMIAGLAFPSLEGAVKTATAARTREMVLADLAGARARAIRGGAAVSLQVTEDGGGYADSAGETRRLPTGEQIRIARAGALAFFPDGSATAQTLILAQGGRQTRIEITSTGLASAAPFNGPGAARP